jgi:hypothetical protein
MMMIVMMMMVMVMVMMMMVMMSNDDDDDDDDDVKILMMMTPCPPLQAGSSKDGVWARGQSAGQSAAKALLEQRANDGANARTDFPGETFIIISSSIVITTITDISIIPSSITITITILARL